MTQAINQFVEWFIKKIVEKHFSDETGAARAQQVAVLICIYSFSQDDEVATIEKITKTYSLSQSQAMRITHRLLERDLIERSQMVNKKTGRGRVFGFKLKETPDFKALLEQLKTNGSS